MNKVHILKIIDILYEQCVASGGDGDGLWYVTYYKLDDIFELVAEYNSTLKFPWELERKDDGIHWGTNQEWILITDIQAVYDAVPSWEQFVLRT